MMDIQIALSDKSIGNAIRNLQSYRDSIAKKESELTKKLADVGLQKATVLYASIPYDGARDVAVDVVGIDNGYAVVASGETVAILEFGAGATLGYGHPQAGQFGMGPGTYPDAKGHWDDPKGWWIPKESGGGHTYGNAPSMAMYEAAKAIRDAVQKVALEVFGSG